VAFLPFRISEANVDNAGLDCFLAAGGAFAAGFGFGAAGF